MKRFLVLFLPFIINSQVIQTKDTIVLDEVSVKILDGKANPDTFVSNNAFLQEVKRLNKKI